jgi:hydroxymethylglutaryl-CoA lyase
MNTDFARYLAGPSAVRLVEVGPRDGLQNEAKAVPLATKLELIERLLAAGYRSIEATAYVSRKAIPQLADHRDLMRSIHHRSGIGFPVLVPNMRGLEEAIEDGVREIAVFTAATDVFNEHNINCNIAESIERFTPMMALARRSALTVRGYVSCAISCPYSGAVPTGKVATVAQQLFDLGCEEISLGDTTGAGTPVTCLAMLEAVSQKIPLSALAGHFHDTRGQGIANIFACWQAGLAVFDSSVGGLGGCPYSPGASGNVASEEVAYLFNGLGVETGINLDLLSQAATFIRRALDLSDPQSSRS